MFLGINHQVEFRVSSINLNLEQLPKLGFVEIGSILDKEKSLSCVIGLITKGLHKWYFCETEEEFSKHGRWNNYAPA